MRLTALLISLLLCLSHGGARVAWAEEAPTTKTQVLEQLDQTIAAALREWDLVPGHAIALVGPDGVIWSEAYGFADKEAQRPATTETPFLLASVSKTLIAAAILSECEAGRLTLMQPINETLPFEVRNPHRPDDEIQLQHLAAHTSGILDHPLHYEEGNYDYDGDATVTLGDWLQSYFVSGGARFDADRNFARTRPGETREYSNVGAALAAYVTECSSGQPYHALLQQRFFTPLEMSHTGFFISEFDDDELAVPYFWEEEQETLERGPHYGGATYPDGWLRASVNDLGNFLAMMINRGRFRDQQVLTAASVEAIETELFPAGEDEDESQACFWNLKFNGKALVHSGYDYGTSTFVFYFPESRMGGIVLNNSNGRGTGAMRMISLQALTNAIGKLSKAR